MTGSAPISAAGSRWLWNDFRFSAHFSRGFRVPKHPATPPFKNNIIAILSLVVVSRATRLHDPFYIYQGYFQSLKAIILKTCTLKIFEKIKIFSLKIYILRNIFFHNSSVQNAIIVIIENTGHAGYKNVWIKTLTWWNYDLNSEMGLRGESYQHKILKRKVQRINQAFWKKVSRRVLPLWTTSFFTSIILFNLRIEYA